MARGLGGGAWEPGNGQLTREGRKIWRREFLWFFWSHETGVNDGTPQFLGPNEVFLLKKHWLIPEWVRTLLSKAIDPSEIPKEATPFGDLSSFPFPYFLPHWEHCWNGEVETGRPEQRSLDFGWFRVSSPGRSSARLSPLPLGFLCHLNRWELSMYIGRDGSHPFTSEGMRVIYTQNGYNRGYVDGGRKQPVPICFPSLLSLLPSYSVVSKRASV